MNSHIWLKLFALASLVTTTTQMNAAPGSLDPSFNGTGFVNKDFAATEKLRAVAVLPDGRIIAAGTTNASGNNDILVVRYNPNGTPDTSFSNDGSEITGLLATSNDTVTAMALQPDGKIIVVGHTNANTGVNLDMFAARFNANGGLDTTFGFNGKYTINPTPSADDQATGVAVLADGKIIIGGSVRTNTSTTFGLARLTSDGILDGGFSGDGYQEISAAGFSQCEAITLQPDGKIIMVGYGRGSGNPDFLVVRCNSNGSLDTSFSGDGVVTTNIAGIDTAFAAALQPDGKILVAGAAGYGTSSAAVRYHADGALDTSFSVNGIYQETFPGFSSFYAVVPQPDGKILLGGASGTLAGRNFTLVRLSNNGSQDTSFDSDGYVVTNINPNGGNFIFSMALQPDGRLITAGQTGNTLSNIALARYNLFQKADALVGVNSSSSFGNNIYNTTGISQEVTMSLKKAGKKNRAFLTFQNDGHEVDSLTIKGTKSDRRFRVEYFNGAKNVTKLVTAGTFSTGSLAAGGSFSLRAEITSQKNAKGKTRKLFISVKSQGDTSSTDTVLITAKGK